MTGGSGGNKSGWGALVRTRYLSSQPWASPEVVGGIQDGLVLRFIDVTVGCAKGIHSYLEGLIDRHAHGVDVNVAVALIAVHLHDMQCCLDSPRTRPVSRKFLG